MTLPARMRALAFSRHGGPEALEVVERPVPAPGPRDALIAVRAVAVAPGDARLRAGALRRHFEIALPKVTGRCGAGVVAALGAEATGLRVGDRVGFVADHASPGAAADFVARPCAAVVRAPDALGFAEVAASLHVGACAWIALVETAGLAAGQRILVQGGAGAIGAAAIELARHLGAWPAATCRKADAEFVAELGAAPVIAYDETPFESVLSGMDAALDLVGGAVHRRSAAVLRPGGALVYLNAAPLETPPPDAAVRVLQARIRDDPDVLARAMALAEAGVLTPRVAATLPLEAGAEAHRMVEAGAARRGRLVLTL